MDVCSVPHPVKRMNKKALRIAIIAGATVLSLVVILAVQPSKKQKKEGNSDLSAVSVAPALPSFLEELPKNYKEIAENTKFAPAKEVVKTTANIKNAENLIIPPSLRTEGFKKTPSIWQKAAKEEEEREAEEHWVSRRSDLFFIKNKDSNKVFPQKNFASSAENRMMVLPRQNLGAVEYNQQGSKQAFLKNNKKESVGQWSPEKSAFSLMQGSIISAVMLTNLNTDLPGPILAQTSENVFDNKTGQNLLIPQGSKLIGEYSPNVSNGQTRAQIVWTRIIFPNTESVTLGRMIGVDQRGTSGYQGTVNNHYGRLAGGIVLSTLLNTGMAMTNQNTNPHDFSAKRALLNSAGNSVSTTAGKLVDKALDVQPTIEVKSGSRVNVFVSQDLFLRPYK